MSGAPARLDATYLLPLKSAAPRADLAGYLAGLAEVVEVVVVDASASDVFAAHEAAWPSTVVHVGVDLDLAGANGKVPGVLTGLRHAHNDAVVIADDDVRYGVAELRAVVARLAHADAVVPQNYFVPLPWHARWDTARTLLNRAVGYDYPGTLGVRRPVLVAAGGYDPDVLFENLELLRTVRAAGGVVRSAPDLFVRREPPTAAHFLNQRVRQAYDSLAQPGRLAIELAILPALAAIARRNGLRGLGVAALGATLLAERGRRRHGGAAVFPPSTTLFAPAWVLERGVCAWAALAARVVAGGVRYGDGRLGRAANPERVIRARLAAGEQPPPTGAPPTTGPVGATR
ncbi:MAG TPA: glycosyltransferase [Egibacteraceae bacterium]|nr:glycosyltransferase [Egibacteraceae bacterium]